MHIYIHICLCVYKCICIYMIGPARMSTNLMCFGRTQAVALTITNSWHWLYILILFVPNLLLNYIYLKLFFLLLRLMQ